MTLDEFNSAVVRTEIADTILLDFRPLGKRQSEALDFWLPTPLKQVGPFAKKCVVKVDTWVILSPVTFARGERILEAAEVVWPICRGR